MMQPLILNKISGLSCFPRHSDPTQTSMLSLLLEEHPEQEEYSWPKGFEGGIAHRLDIPTSGQLIVARNPMDLVQIRSLFSAKKLRKEYFFLSQKSVPWTQNRISASIAHDRRRKKRMVVQRGQNTPKKGRWLDAQTEFSHVGRNNGISLWRAQMSTGVMHQIRIHAAFAGIALWGDRLYGGGESPDCFPSSFALHHAGIEYSAWEMSKIPLPYWWPKWTQDLISD